MKLVVPFFVAAVTAALLVPFIPAPAEAQFPAESTIPMKQRKGRKIAQGPEGPTPRTKDGSIPT